MTALSHARLLELLAYSPETGAFYWRVRAGCRAAGSAAGSTRRDGYVTVRVDGSRHFAHRLAWFYCHGAWPMQTVDHIDGNPSNNQLSNLRDVSHRKNLHNRTRPQSNNTHGFLGVKRANRSRWVATLKRDGAPAYIGSFSSAAEAHAAYLAEKAKLMEAL